jgi:hypothetical protein
METNVLKPFANRTDELRWTINTLKENILCLERHDISAKSDTKALIAAQAELIEILLSRREGGE